MNAINQTTIKFRKLAGILLSLITFISIVDQAQARSDRVRRIVGGQKAEHATYPWMFSIQTSSNKRLTHCGATLVSPQFLMTAAHCVSPKERYEEIYEVTIDKVPGSLTSSTPWIEKWIVHPKYQKKDNYEYDLALLRLSHPVQGVTPVNLPASQPTTNVLAQAIGWGATQPDKTLPSSHLLHISLPLRPLKECRSPDEKAPELTDNMICAGAYQDGTSICDGDSGGPLFLNNPDGSVTQIGITSFTFSSKGSPPDKACGNALYPGIFTNIWSLKSFITEQTLQWQPGINPHQYRHENNSRSRTFYISESNTLKIEIKGNLKKNRGFLSLHDESGYELRRFSGNLDKKLYLPTSRITAKLEWEKGVNAEDLHIQVQVSDATADLSRDKRHQIRHPGSLETDFSGEHPVVKWDMGTYSSNETRTSPQMGIDQASRLLVHIKTSLHKKDTLMILDATGNEIKAFNGEVNEWLAVSDNRIFAKLMTGETPPDHPSHENTVTVQPCDDCEHDNISTWYMPAQMRDPTGSPTLSVPDAKGLKVHISGHTSSTKDALILYDSTSSQLMQLSGKLDETFLVEGDRIFARYLPDDHFQWAFNNDQFLKAPRSEAGIRVSITPLTESPGTKGTSLKEEASKVTWNSGDFDNDQTRLSPTLSIPGARSLRVNLKGELTDADQVTLKDFKGRDLPTMTGRIRQEFVITGASLQASLASGKAPARRGHEYHIINSWRHRHHHQKTTRYLNIEITDNLDAETPARTWFALSGASGETLQSPDLLASEAESLKVSVHGQELESGDTLSVFDSTGFEARRYTGRTTEDFHVHGNQITARLTKHSPDTLSFLMISILPVSSIDQHPNGYFVSEPAKTVWNSGPYGKNEQRTSPELVVASASFMKCSVTGALTNAGDTLDLIDPEYPEQPLQRIKGSGFINECLILPVNRLLARLKTDAEGGPGAITVTVRPQEPDSSGLIRFPEDVQDNRLEKPLYLTLYNAAELTVQQLEVKDTAVFVAMKQDVSLDPEDNTGVYYGIQGNQVVYVPNLNDDKELTRRFTVSASAWKHSQPFLASQQTLEIPGAPALKVVTTGITRAKASFLLILDSEHLPVRRISGHLEDEFIVQGDRITVKPDADSNSHFFTQIEPAPRGEVESTSLPQFHRSDDGNDILWQSGTYGNHEDRTSPPLGIHSEEPMMRVTVSGELETGKDYLYLYSLQRSVPELELTGSLHMNATFPAGNLTARLVSDGYNTSSGITIQVHGFTPEPPEKPVIAEEPVTVTVTQSSAATKTAYHALTVISAVLAVLLAGG